MTMMYSPIGGWQDVTPGDIEGMKKIGWVCEGEPGYVDGWAKFKKDPPPGNDGPTHPPALTLEQLRIQWQAKHGKKPHHLKSAETLRKEL